MAVTLKKHTNAWDLVEKERTLRSKGLSDEEIRKEIGFGSVSAFRFALMIAEKYTNQDTIETIGELRSENHTFKEIADILGIPEATVRSKYYYKRKDEEK